MLLQNKKASLLNEGRVRSCQFPTVSLHFLKNLPSPVLCQSFLVPRWCNTRQTEDRSWVSIAMWRRRQCVWRRSACTLCPASPSTTRTATGRLAARPKPQVGAAIFLSAPPLLFSSSIETIPRTVRILAVISSALQPVLPAQASSFLFCHLVPISTLKTEQTLLIPRQPKTQGHASLFSSGC